MPVDAFARFADFPHEREAGAVENHYGEAGTVAMGFFVSTDRPAGEVEKHHRPGEADAHAVSILGAIAALFEAAFFFQRVNVFAREPLAHIRDEVGLNTVETGEHLRRFGEIVFLFSEAVEKFIVAVEQKIVVVEELHVKRRGRAGH